MLNREYYKHIPLGESIPLNNPYAFSVSMPTIADVIDYEEGTERSKKSITQAYPRILFHPYIERILMLASKDLKLDEYALFLLPTKQSAEKVAKLSGTTALFYDYYGYTISALKKEMKDDVASYYSFMKHCGFMIFAREAEDLLIKLGEKITPKNEDSVVLDSDSIIKNILSEGYNSDNILLSSSGMNAIFSGFEAVKKRGVKNGRKLFILFGWAYSDTIQILKKCTEELIMVPDVSSIKELEDLLEKRGHEVACLYMETVSNPLIEVPDFPKVHALSRLYDFPLLIDNTFATSWNVDISPYSDLIFESLTKFASGNGDLMAGALILPKDSILDSLILEESRDSIIPLYSRVQYRLAYSIVGYKERVLKINKNAKIIFDYLSNNNKIDKLYSVYNSSHVGNWNKIARDSDSFCGVISIVFKDNVENVYDNINIPKGPSLGTEFPILMSYTLLAHYNETKTVEGRRYLKEVGISPDLLRLSVGSDNPQLIIDEIERI